MWNFDELIKGLDPQQSDRVLELLDKAIISNIASTVAIQAMDECDNDDKDAEARRKLLEQKMASIVGVAIVVVALCEIVVGRPYPISLDLAVSNTVKKINEV